MSNVTSPNAQEYPLNLLDDLAPDDEWEHDIPADIGPSLAYVIATLTEREQKVIMARYKDRRTYEDIGKEWGVTRERIRQIEAKALRKMRHPERKKYLIYGVKGWYLNEAEKGLHNELSRAADDLSAIARAITAVDGMDELMKFSNNREQWKKDHPQLDTPIDDLDLSVRSYTCLRRANVKTIGDIANMTDEQLKRIRNLGKKSYEEILSKLYKNGLTLKSKEEVIQQDELD